MRSRHRRRDRSPRESHARLHRSFRGRWSIPARRACRRAGDRESTALPENTADRSGDWSSFNGVGTQMTTVSHSAITPASVVAENPVRSISSTSVSAMSSTCRKPAVQPCHDVITEIQTRAGVAGASRFERQREPHVPETDDHQMSKIVWHDYPPLTIQRRYLVESRLNRPRSDQVVAVAPSYSVVFLRARRKSGGSNRHAVAASEDAGFMDDSDGVHDHPPGRSATATTPPTHRAARCRVRLSRTHTVRTRSNQPIRIATARGSCRNRCPAPGSNVNSAAPWAWASCRASEVGMLSSSSPCITSRGRGAKRRAAALGLKRRNARDQSSIELGNPGVRMAPISRA